MRTRHFYLLCVTAAVVLTVFSGCGQKSNPLKQKAATKPWADVDSTAQIEADSLAMAEADSLAFCAPEFYQIGDCMKSDSIIAATKAAYAAANDI